MAAPLGNGQGGVNAAAGGTGSNGVTGTAGSGTAGTGTGGAGQPVQPPIGPVTNPAEIAQYFASLPCGAKYTALGDGGWQFCLRLADGGGACANGSEVFQRVSFEGGGAVPNVTQVSGFADGSIAVVTAGGALHTGSSVAGINPTALIASDVVNFSGGYHARVALVDEGTGFGVRSWADNGTPAPVALPGGALPVQVSANYGLACALSNAGDAVCWDVGGNHGLGLTAAPSRIALAKPVKLISVGQNSVCGISFEDTLECQAAWYDNPYLPTEAVGQSFQIRQASFPTVREIHAGFRQGVIVRGDGAAFFLPGNGAGTDNPGVQFTGATDVIAAGGDRGNACVQTSTGSVYCMVAGATRQATLGGASLTAQAAACPL